MQDDDLVFKLRVLGSFELVRGPSEEPIEITSAKMRALLAYLATLPAGTESRRHIAGLLWAGRSEEQARQSMRQLLSALRRGPCAPLLLTSDQSRVGIDLSRIEIDRNELLPLPADADIDTLSRVADLYRGDFVAGLEIGEPDFESWLQVERLRCREAAVTLFDRLARALADQGRHEEALRRANRLLEFDPLREETHRLIIAEEAVVSGRATAMQRYEGFRILLRDELGVRPEASTLRLLDELRQPEAKDAREPRATAPVAPNAKPKPRRWPRPPIGAGVATVLLLAIVAWQWLQPQSEPPLAYIDDASGRASVVILPFECDVDNKELKARAQTFEAQTRLAFTRHYRMTVIDLPETAIIRDAVATGRSLRARYVVRTRLSETADGVSADVSVLDSATGISLATTPFAMTDPPFKFARQMVRFVFPEIALNRAKALSEIDADSLAALSWRGAAAQIRTRVGSIDPDAFDLFERVLARDPNNFEALMALVGGLQLRVARGQSADRTSDLDRSEALLMKARAQRPNLAEIAFLEGMSKKLRTRFAEAAPYFDRAVQLDPAHWHAALEAAHVKMFLGQFEEANQDMEAAAVNLLPDIGAPESAYLAGEIALVANHVDRALTYFEIALRGNPTVARIQALYAAALWRAGRHDEAHSAAMLSQTLTPPFGPTQLAARGGTGASDRYREALDRSVTAFRSAIAGIPAKDMSSAVQGSAR